MATMGNIRGISGNNKQHTYTLVVGILNRIYSDSEIGIGSGIRIGFGIGFGISSRIGIRIGFGTGIGSRINSGIEISSGTSMRMDRWFFSGYIHNLF